ncbi:MAG: muconate/chloromuconate family cycloisomerase [Pseudomonadota bacterium]
MKQTMVAIDRVEAVIIDVPTIRPHVLAMATMRVQTALLVIVTRSDGVQGVGEANTISGLTYGDESTQSMKVNIDAYLGPLLIGADADNINGAMARLDGAAVGNRFAKCALETALYDASARAMGAPISSLFGGRRREALSMAWVLASGDTAKDIDEGQQMLDTKRHRIFKLKIGLKSVAEDCAHVAAIAEALGRGAEIRVDVNQHWTRRQAQDGCARLQDVGVTLVEQPLKGSDHVGARALMERFDLAIMADEALSGPLSAYDLARTASADVFALKIAQSGGLRAAKEVAAIAEVADIALYGGTMLEGPVGSLASAQLFATLPALEWDTELFAPLLLTENVAQEALVYEDYELKLPTGPGLGVAMDWDKIDALAQDGQPKITRVGA